MGLGKKSKAELAMRGLFGVWAPWQAESPGQLTAARSGLDQRVTRQRFGDRKQHEGKLSSLSIFHLAAVSVFAKQQASKSAALLTPLSFAEVMRHRRPGRNNALGGANAAETLWRPRALRSLWFMALRATCHTAPLRLLAACCCCCSACCFLGKHNKRTTIEAKRMNAFAWYIMFWWVYQTSRHN